LQSALRWSVDGLARRSEINASLSLQPEDFPRLAPELETAIFRIIQEALTNIVRHAQARNAYVAVVKEKKRVVITVRDDGKGIAEQIADFRPGSLGVGIGGMRQRTKEFGGELRIQNLHPGTLVEVVIPYESDAVHSSSMLASVG
jgi:two-component system, NarL family, sensor histidine kinase UhpB